MPSRPTPPHCFLHSPSLAFFAPVVLHLPSICVDSIFLKTNPIAKIPMHQTRLSVLRIKNHSPNSPIRLIRNNPFLHPFVPLFQLNQAIEPRSTQATAHATIRPIRPLHTPPFPHLFVPSFCRKRNESSPITGGLALLGFGLGTTRSSCPGCTALNTNLHRVYQKVFSAFLALSAVKSSCSVFSVCSVVQCSSPQGGIINLERLFLPAAPKKERVT